MCSSIDLNGKPAQLDIGRIHKAVDDAAAKGLRVLAFARRDLGQDMHDINHADLSGMTFLGLQCMIDPPREEAINAVRKCNTAGIRVKMITGDHALTASAIAQQIGLPNSANVVTGKALAEISDKELIDVADRASVFARVAPEQKFRSEVHRWVIARDLLRNGMPAD